MISGEILFETTRGFLLSLAGGIQFIISIAHYKEMYNDPCKVIYRPRQVYTGDTDQKYVTIEEKK